MVAVGAGARLQPLTFRPMGPPFARQLRLSGRLRSEILSGDRPSPWSTRGRVFPAVRSARSATCWTPAAWGAIASPTFPATRRAGAARQSGPSRALATGAARRGRFRCAGAGRGAPGRRLDRWVADLVGPIAEARRDLSGGRWRAVRGVPAPATPAWSATSSSTGPPRANGWPSSRGWASTAPPRPGRRGCWRPPASARRSRVFGTAFWSRPGWATDGRWSRRGASAGPAGLPGPLPGLSRSPVSGHAAGRRVPRGPARHGPRQQRRSAGRRGGRGGH
jgi:hypothetical protein